MVVNISGRNLESEVYPSSASIIPSQAQAASVALMDVLHAPPWEWVPEEIVCGSFKQKCICQGNQY